MEEHDLVTNSFNVIHNRNIFQKIQQSVLRKISTQFTSHIPVKSEPSANVRSKKPHHTFICTLWKPFVIVQDIFCNDNICLLWPLFKRCFYQLFLFYILNHYQVFSLWWWMIIWKTFTIPLATISNYSIALSMKGIFEKLVMTVVWKRYDLLNN